MRIKNKRKRIRHRPISLGGSSCCHTGCVVLRCQLSFCSPGSFFTKTKVGLHPWVLCYFMMLWPSLYCTPRKTVNITKLLAQNPGCPTCSSPAGVDSPVHRCKLKGKAKGVGNPCGKQARGVCCASQTQCPGIRVSLWLDLSNNRALPKRGDPHFDVASSG